MSGNQEQWLTGDLENNKYGVPVYNQDTIFIICHYNLTVFSRTTVNGYIFPALPAALKNAPFTSTIEIFPSKPYSFFFTGLNNSFFNSLFNLV